MLSKSTCLEIVPSLLLLLDQKNCIFCDLGSRKPRTKVLKQNYHLPLFPGTIVSIFHLVLLLL